MAGAVPTSRPGEPSGGPPEPPFERPPVLLDFFPMEEVQQTRLSRFFDELRLGRLMTTRCPRDGSLSWPPRVVCPKCHSEEQEWIELPRHGTVYAFSAVLAGAPMGMESDVPFVVGLIDLTGVPLRLFGRIVGRTWDRCTVGMSVTAEPFDLPDGRVFYRFRAPE